MWGLVVWTFLIVGLIAAVMAIWKPLVVILALYAAWKLARWWWHSRQARIARQETAAEAKRARLIAHADREHRQVQQGNVDGIYGAYPVPDETRGMGIWLTDKERPRRDDGAARDVGFAG